MPLPRYLMILALVLLAAAVTVWGAVQLAPGAIPLLIPVALVLALVLRRIGR